MKFNTVYNKENHLVLTLSDQCGGARRPSQPCLHGYRVCTDFWIQNSRFSPDFLPQQCIFPVSRLSNMWAIEEGTKLFFMMNWNKSMGKNSQDFFIIFFRLNLHFPDFFEVLKIAGQISWLFLKNSRWCPLGFIEPLDPTSVSLINIKQRGAVKWSRRGNGETGCSLGIRDTQIVHILLRILQIMFDSLWIFFIHAWSIF